MPNPQIGEIIDGYRFNGGDPNAQDSWSLGPKVGDVVDGYTYKGGDPNNQESWTDKPEKSSLLSRAMKSFGSGNNIAVPDSITRDPLAVEAEDQPVAKKRIGSVMDDYDPQQDSRSLHGKSFSDASHDVIADQKLLAEEEARNSTGQMQASPLRNSASDVAQGLASGFKTGIGKNAATAIRGVGNFLRTESIGNSALQSAGSEIESSGKSLYDKYSKEEQRNQPEFETATGRGLYSGARSLENMLATLLATGGNPGAALIGMSGQVGLSEAGNALDKGKDYFESGAYGLGQGALEFVTEKLPMGFIADKLGKEGFKKFVGGYLLREMPSEQVATLAQDALQKAVLEPGKTWVDYLKERPGAAYETALATAAMTGGMGAVNAGMQIPSRLADINAKEEADVARAKALSAWSNAFPKAAPVPSPAEILTAPTIDSAIAAAHESINIPMPEPVVAPVQPVSMPSVEESILTREAAKIDQDQLLANIEASLQPTGSLLVSGKDAAEAVELIAPDATKIKRKDGSVLVSPRFAEPVMQAIESAKPVTEETNVAEPEQVAQEAPQADVAQARTEPAAAPQDEGLAARIQSATPAELLLMRDRHGNQLVRDAASSELKRREEEYAYQQREQQKATELDAIKSEATDQQIAQAEAMFDQPEIENALSAAIKKAGLAKSIQPEMKFSREDSSTLDSANRRISKFVDAYTAGQLKEGDTQLLGDTPVVLQALGKRNHQIQIDYATVSKVLGGKHRLDITPDLLKQIPSAIYDPIAVFDQENGGVLMLTNMVAETGNPVVTAIHFDVNDRRMRINRIASIYEYSRAEDRLAEQIKSLLYMKSKEALATSTMAATPNWADMVQKMQELGKSILTESDVVKLYGSRYSVSNPEQASGQKSTVEDLRTAIADQYGQTALNQLERKGIVHIAQSIDDAISQAAEMHVSKNGGDVDAVRDSLMSKSDVKLSSDGQVQGFYMPSIGTSFLVADNIAAQDAPAVLAHEIGVHAGNDMAPIFEQAGRMLKLGKGNPFFDRVRNRMESAGETSNEEAAAYIVEEYEKDRIRSPRSVARWFADFMAAVRGWLYRKGVLISSSKLTPADLAAIARANVKSVAAETSEGSIKFSKSLPDTINVDGVDRPTRNSNGKLIAQTEEGLRNFWKWFGDSKVVDSEGRPMVVYHGTTADVDRFDLAFSGSDGVGYDVPAIFATTDKKLANDYSLNKFNREIADTMRAMQRFKNENPGVYGDEYERLYEDVKHAFAKQREEGRPELGGGANVIPLYMRGDMTEVDANGQRFMAVMPKALPDAMAQGKDGVIINDVIDNASPATDYPARVFVTFEPNNVKSATGNSGSFDGSNPSILFSKASNQQTKPQSLPAETKAQANQRVIQDKFNRFEVVNKWAKDNGLKLSEQANVYRAEERYHGRVATRLEDFREKVVQPIIEKVQKAGFTMQDVSDFLEAQHTAEANKQIQETTGDKTATAAGISDKEAADYLSKASPELAKVANEFRDITVKTKRLLVSSGIVSPEMAAAWDSAYQYYVPLKGGPGEMPQKTGTGPGLSVNGKQKRRLGHGKRQEFVIENIIRDYERAMIASEKNLVGQHLIKLALEVSSLDPTLITIDQPQKRKTLVEGKTSYDVTYQGSLVSSFETKSDASRYVTSIGKAGMDIVPVYGDPHTQMMASPMLQENEATVYVSGKSVRVQINDPILARAYKNLGVEHLNGILKAARGLNNWLSKAYTGFNPEFVLVNMARDFTGGLINLTGNYGAAMSARAVKNYPKAFAEVLRYSLTGVAGSNVEQYRSNGGSTGAAYLSDIERIGSDIQTAYDDYVGVIENIKSGHNMKAARIAGEKVIGKVLGWIEHINAASENAMRLAAFMAVRDNTGSVAEAASAAKNVTVNFNRKGEVGSELGALYLFANPNIQGTAALYKALFSSEHKAEAWALVGAMAGLAALAASQFDDDEWELIPEYEKDRNLLIRAGDRRIKIPVPYGYGFFFGLGNVYKNISSGQSTMKVASHLASAFFEHFSPFGNPIQGPVSMLPTAIQIPIKPWLNINESGRKIVPEYQDSDKNKPDFMKMNRATKGSIYDSTASMVNSATGGTKGTSGMIDVSPETLKYWTKTLTGGTGAFYADLANFGSVAFQGGDPESHEIPVLRKFISEPRINDARQAYYQKVEDAEKAWDQFKAARKANDVEGISKLKDQRELFALAKASERQRSAIKSIRDREDKILNDESMSLGDRRLKVKELELLERKLYDKVLSANKR